MYSQEVVLMNTTGEFATFGATKPLKVIERTPQNLTHPSLNGSSAVDSALLPIGSNQPNMSIAFREVLKDYNSEMSDNQTKSPLSLEGLHRKDKFSESFYVGDKLLTSNDNIRPKSRSKTVIAGYDIHKYSHLNGDSRTLHAKDYSLDNSSKDYVKKSSSQHGVLSPVSVSNKEDKNDSNNAQEIPVNNKEVHIKDVMKRHEYIPSMSDIRSQRAVKSRLQTLEKDAAKKQEKRKEANAKLEKQQSKEREKQLKIRQRREIYALNKIMTELENTRFLDFCQAKGLNKV